MKTSPWLRACSMKGAALVVRPVFIVAQAFQPAVCSGGTGILACGGTDIPLVGQRFLSLVGRTFLSVIGPASGGVYAPRAGPSVFPCLSSMCGLRGTGMSPTRPHIDRQECPSHQGERPKTQDQRQRPCRLESLHYNITSA